ncbi:MAG: hypothetical protein GXP10_09630 [Gammaproteobacteria bacterium]|nr:hypothetical protein [Gammaproteobacteria bacterium]
MRSYQLENLSQLRSHLGRRGALFEPRQAEDGGELHWLPMVDSAWPHEVEETPLLPLTSPKSFFFKEREQLFYFDGKQFVETLPDIEPQTLFGVRSCDLCAIAYLDQFFAADPYYQKRRQATLLVGIDCLHPCDGGFCRSVDAGPFVREASADLICHRQADGHWLLIASTEAGEEAVQGLELKAANEASLRQRDLRQKEVSEKFPDTSYLHAAIKRINNSDGGVAHTTWDALGLQCLTCSGCTNSCPTCSCFAIFEQTTDEGVARQRCWDSCYFEAFQREASGHNPSGEAGQRVKRYWEHKFSESYAATFGRYGCVGCGRCEKVCPGVIGVHSVTKRLATAS